MMMTTMTMTMTMTIMMDEHCCYAVEVDAVVDGDVHDDVDLGPVAWGLANSVASRGTPE